MAIILSALLNCNQNLRTTYKIILPKWKDILWNVAIPILAGVAIYIFKHVALLPQIIQNYFADAFWAYAFSSTILIIWNRKLSIIWIIIAFFSAFSLELLQYGEYIAGTGDINDIVVYALFFSLPIFLNKYFKHFELIQTNSYE